MSVHGAAPVISSASAVRSVGIEKGCSDHESYRNCQKNRRSRARCHSQGDPPYHADSGGRPDTDNIDTRYPILVLNHGHFQKNWSGSRGLIGGGILSEPIVDMSHRTEHRGRASEKECQKSDAKSTFGASGSARNRLTSLGIWRSFRSSPLHYPPLRLKHYHDTINSSLVNEQLRRRGCTVFADATVQPNATRVFGLKRPGCSTGALYSAATACANGLTV